MVVINVNESLNLYFFLTEMDVLSVCLEELMIKIEAELFKKYSVREIEEFSLMYRDKGRV